MLAYAPVEDYEDKYEELDLVGEGGYGKVFRVQLKQGYEVFASKHIKTVKKKDKKNAKSEIELLKTISSPHVIAFIEAFESTKSIIMITEYLDGGELFERVVDEDFQLVESECCLFMKQIYQGMEYLHSKYIVHLDIKVRNYVTFVS
jgi:myosin-light-chain kinase